MLTFAICMFQAEQLSYSQFMDYIVIGVMAAIWTLMPNDGIAVITNWFYEKVMNVSSILSLLFSFIVYNNYKLIIQ